MNPTAVSNTLSILPYLAVGIVVVVLVSLGVLRFSMRFFCRQQERATYRIELQDMPWGFQKT
jgi:hypothetical protein